LQVCRAALCWLLLQLTAVLLLLSLLLLRCEPLPVQTLLCLADGPRPQHSSYQSTHGIALFVLLSLLLLLHRCTQPWLH
jgi:hypothetical protein